MCEIPLRVRQCFVEDSFSLHRIYIQSVDMFGNRVGPLPAFGHRHSLVCPCKQQFSDEQHSGSTGFVKLKSEVADRDGDSLAGLLECSRYVIEVCFTQLSDL